LVRRAGTPKTNKPAIVTAITSRNNYYHPRNNIHISQTDDGDDSTTTLRTVGLLLGEVNTYTTATMHDGIGSMLQFGGGWSPDGRYIAILSVNFSSSFAQELDCVDTVSGRVSDIYQSASNNTLYPIHWGPNSQLAFQTDESDHALYSIYDAPSGKSVIGPLAMGTDYVGWADENELLVRGPDAKRNELNVATGILTPADAGVKVVQRNGPLWKSTIELPDGSSSLSLQTWPMRAAAVSDDGAKHAETITLWIRVGDLPPVPKKRSPSELLQLDTLLENGSNMLVFVPNSSNSSTVQAVYVKEGNLYQSTIGFDQATVREASEAGEKLTCAEEILLAEDNAKHMGLDILQWSQDNDEKLPAADGFHDEVGPYVQGDGFNDEIFTTDKYPFNYEMDGQSLTTIDDPAATEEGSIQLPCAKVVLFADGHVKVFQAVPNGSQ
jgi:hypothetical protein